MSAHELEHPKEERPGFTGVKLSELRPGMVIYRHGSGSEVLQCYEDRLCHYVFIRARIDESVDLRRVPIGAGYCSQFAVDWKPWDGFLKTRYSRMPTPEYMVLNGLGLPDELLYEIYQFTARYFVDKGLVVL